MVCPVEVKDRILAAAVSCLETGGVDSVSVSSVAERAGVSRPTVYAHFGTRDLLLSEALRVVSGRTVTAVVEAVADATSPSEFLVEAMVAARSSFRSSPAFAPLVHPRPGSVISDETVFAPAVLAMASAFLAPALVDVAAAEHDEIADLCIRLFLSLIQLDSAATRSDEDLRGYLRRRLLPSLHLRPRA